MIYKRLAVTAILLSAIVLAALGASALFAESRDYDKNNDGLIDGGEAYQAIQDHYDGKISQDETVDVLLRYWGRIPMATPTPRPTATPTPRALYAPTITFTRINKESIQINWQRSNSHDVTGYEIRYRQVGTGQWMTFQTSPSTSGVGQAGTFIVGARYEIQVRAISRAGVSPWATTILTVPAPVPTPTPTPRPSPTPVPTPMSNAYGMGCVGHESYPSDDNYAVVTQIVSDIKLAAIFANPPTPKHQPWAPPQLPEFQYGFMLRSIPDVDKALLVLVNSDSEWSVALREERKFYPLEARDGATYYEGRLTYYTQRWGYPTPAVVLSSGSFTDTSIPFNTGPQERNHVMFLAEGDSYTMAVNGHLVPLDIDAVDLAAVEAVIGRYRHLDDGEWHGHYNRTYLAGGSTRPEASTGGTYNVSERSMGRWVTVIKPLPWAACKP